MVKIAHLSDLHIGAWRDPDMRALTLEAFEKAAEKILDKNIDIVIIAGDFFHTALPPLDIVKQAVRVLRKLKDNGIEIVAIPGSHDFSPSGKSMLDILEESGIIKIVSKAEAQHEHDGGKLNLKKFEIKDVVFYGIPGRTRALEKTYYEMLNPPEIDKEKINIFVMHTAIKEFLSVRLSNVEAIPLSLVPKGFDYYANGHVHEKNIFFKNDILMGFPGPLFPDNYEELEHIGLGNFFILYINEDIQEDNTNQVKRYEVNGKTIFIQEVPILVKNVINIDIDCNGLSPAEIKERIIKELNSKELYDCIVLLRLKGKLSSGRINEIDFKTISKLVEEKQAFKLLKNISKLHTPEYKEVKVQQHPIHEVEEEIINANIGKYKHVFDTNKEKELIYLLMDILSRPRGEDESKANYEERIVSSGIEKIDNFVNNLIENNRNKEQDQHQDDQDSIDYQRGQLQVQGQEQEEKEKRQQFQ